MAWHGVAFMVGPCSQVRVANLQELVYKQGHARVTKASVTLVFDNSDEKSSPVGMKDKAEITVTRQVGLGGLARDSMQYVSRVAFAFVQREGGHWFISASAVTGGHWWS